jgi:hypothetical protein
MNFFLRPRLAAVARQSYAQNIESVLFEGKEVIGLISELQFSELELLGIDKLAKTIKEGEEYYE